MHPPTPPSRHTTLTPPFTHSKSMIFKQSHFLPFIAFAARLEQHTQHVIIYLSGRSPAWKGTAGYSGLQLNGGEARSVRTYIKSVSINVCQKLSVESWEKWQWS
jgi:hypothetical protein